jgi:hypothetical protein
MGLRCACARGRMVVTAYLNLQLLRRCGTYVYTCVYMYKLLCAGDGGSVLGFVTEAAIRQSSDDRVIQRSSFFCMYMLTYLPNIVLELLLTSHGLACMASTPCFSWQIRRQALLWRWRALNGWSCKLGFILRGLRRDVLCMHSWHFPLTHRIRDLWMMSCLRG